MATVSALHVKGDVIEHYIRARKSMSKKKEKRKKACSRFVILSPE